MRELVSAKRRWSSPQKRADALLGFRGWHERGYLPHRDEPGLTQFITFHLADAFPANLRAEWAAMLEIEDQRERRNQLAQYLDKGRGTCWLSRPQFGGLVDQAIRFYHQKRYDLLAWVVMPNHVHALFKVNTIPLSIIVADLKKYTAREANNKLGRRGQFWADEYWDTFMRNAEHELKTRRYIESNPTKAYLVQDPKDWPWSSARFRDDHGVLRV